MKKSEYHTEAAMTIKFAYDEVSKQARTSDPEIYVDRLSVSKEEVHAFLLHWHHRKIVFKATVVVTGSPPERHHDWTITGIGNIHPRVPAYHFNSKPEIKEASDLAFAAMAVMPRSLLPDEMPVIKVQLSPALETIISNFPN